MVGEVGVRATFEVGFDGEGGGGARGGTCRFGKLKLDVGGGCGVGGDADALALLTASEGEGHWGLPNARASGDSDSGGDC